MDTPAVCRRRALECARRAVYAPNAKTRKAFARAAESWLRLAQQSESDTVAPIGRVQATGN
jgi:hypothetical protein